MEEEIASIKRDRLVGVEQQPTMYALAASNMYLRGDGKANLHQGSCFDESIFMGVKSHNATVGLINPPYAKSKADLSELRFVERMLDSLQKGGRGVAVIPVSCVASPSQEKHDLMSKHTLEAVMSMPPETFYPVGVVTCVVVFTAGIPHATSAKKSWFGYWREDGFVKVKNLGRVDRNATWPQIRDRWVEMFRNKEVQPGESVMTKVGPDDEWLAEAYMETDYSTLGQADFEKVLMDYALFTLRSGVSGTEDDD
jgi:type I restriction-modification system DNA methylase subunit